MTEKTKPARTAELHRWSLGAQDGTQAILIFSRPPTLKEMAKFRRYVDLLEPEESAPGPSGES